MAGAAACLGLGFLLAAAFIWAEQRYGPIEAALGFGIGFLVIGGLVLLIYRLGAGSRARRQAKRRKADMTAIGVTTALALLPTLLRGKGGLAALVTPVVAAAAYAIYQENKKPGDGPGSGKPE